MEVLCYSTQFSAFVCDIRVISPYWITTIFSSSREYTIPSRLLQSSDLTFYNSDMATLIGNKLLWDQQIVIDFCNRMRFGIKNENDKVTWGILREMQVCYADGA